MQLKKKYVFEDALNSILLLYLGVAKRYGISFFCIVIAAVCQ